MRNLLNTKQSLFIDFVQRSLASCHAIAFVSFEKSSGKSSTFRAFLNAAKGITCGMTSIGADPSSGKDPAIGNHFHYVKPGSIIATARQCLTFCEPTRTILADTAVNTPLGEVIIFRAESAGRVFLAGPSIIADAISIKNTLFGLGAECVLMDGAGGRISPATSLLADGVVLCANLTPDIAQTHQTLQYQVNLLQTKPVEDARLREMAQQVCNSRFPCTLIDNDYAVYGINNNETLNHMIELVKQHNQAVHAINITGALTDRQADELIKLSEANPTIMEKFVVIVEDPTKLLISSRTMDSIQASPLSLRIWQPIRLLGIALNRAGTAIETDQFQILCEQFASDWQLPVFDVQRGFFIENSD